MWDYPCRCPLRLGPIAIVMAAKMTTVEAAGIGSAWTGQQKSTDREVASALAGSKACERVTNKDICQLVFRRSSARIRQAFSKPTSITYDDFT